MLLYPGVYALDLIKTKAATEKYITRVCTGSLLLSKAELLKGKKILSTTNFPIFTFCNLYFGFFRQQLFFILYLTINHK